MKLVIPVTNYLINENLLEGWMNVLVWIFMDIQKVCFLTTSIQNKIMFQSTVAGFNAEGQ